MAHKLNHELFSSTRIRAKISWPTLVVLAVAVAAVALAANWDRLTVTDWDRLQAAYVAGDFDAAVEIAKKIAAANPSSAQTQLVVAATYTQKAVAGQDPAGSLALARQAAFLAGKIDPSDPGVGVAVGRTYELEGDLKSAIEQYQGAVNVSPKSVLALTHLGNALVAQGKISAGERYLELAVQADPLDLWARVFLARVWVTQAEQSAATTEKLLEPAAASADSLAAAEAKAIVSGFRLRAGKSAEAEALAREAVELSPESAEANLALGEALYDGVFARGLPWDETFAEVRAIGDRVAAIDPARAAGPYLALRAAVRLGDKAAAAAYAKQALSLAAKDPTLDAAARAEMRAKIQAAYAQ